MDNILTAFNTKLPKSNMLPLGDTMKSEQAGSGKEICMGMMVMMMMVMMMMMLSMMMMMNTSFHKCNTVIKSLCPSLLSGLLTRPNAPRM